MKDLSKIISPSKGTQDMEEDYFKEDWMRERETTTLNEEKRMR